MIEVTVPLPNGETVVSMSGDGTWSGSVTPVGTGVVHQVAVVVTDGRPTAYVDGEQVAILRNLPESREPAEIERWLTS